MRAWLERSFRNRIFLTVLLVALVPLLLCDVLMTQVMIFRSEHTLRTDAQEEMALLTAQLDALLTDCGDVTRALAGSTVTRSALRRGGSDSRTWRDRSMDHRPSAPVASVTASARRSHSAWKTGSSGSTSTGPKPCMPPRSWTPSIVSSPRRRRRPMLRPDTRPRAPCRPEPSRPVSRRPVWSPAPCRSSRRG